MRNTKEKKLRKYPYWIALIVLAVSFVVLQVLVILDCFKPLIVFETDAVSSVMSTCSEVIAGMYGITLTGYIFFADRFKDTSRDDETLYDAVQALLLRYNHMAGYISLLSLVSILLNEAIVLYGNNTLLPQWLYRFIVYEALMVFYVTFNLILYFVISVLDPQKVSRISSQKKEQLSKNADTGDQEAFMSDWLAIEDHLRGLMDNLLHTIRFIPGSRNKPEIIHTLETLRNYGRIDPSLWKNLEKLRQYHNLSLYDPSMTVSKEMCDLAKSVRAELERKH